jgi:hypothetical protein
LEQAVTDRAARRREQKRDWARRNYAANQESEQERCKAVKRQARGDETPVEQVVARLKYDKHSYIDEWLFLTWGGRRSDDILAASDPSIDWFNLNVMPHVGRSICATCEDMFDPRVARSLTRCSKTCGLV